MGIVKRFVKIITWYVFPFSDSAKKGFRSNSAIDLQAAQRAKARAQYSAMARNKIQSGTASLRKCCNCKFQLEIQFFTFT